MKLIVNNKKGTSVTDEMIASGVERSLTQAHLHHRDIIDFKKHAFIKAVIKHYYVDMDAYQLAKLLDGQGWGVNADFVEDMRTVLDCIDIERDAVTSSVTLVDQTESQLALVAI